MNETQTPKTNMFIENLKKTWANMPKVKMDLKALIVLVAIFFVAFLTYFFKGVFVAAIVNGKPISRFAVIKELEKQGGGQVLDTLITKELINGEIKRKGVTVSQTEVDAEIKNIENSLVAQGTTLDKALAAQNLTRTKLVEEVKFNKLVEKLVVDKTAVTDAEVNQYITDNKATFPKDTNLVTIKPQVMETLRQQKLSSAVQALLADLKAKAKVWYWVKYN